MEREHEQTRGDLARIAGSGFIPWEKLRGKTVLVTGATGLIGRALTAALVYASRSRRLDLKVLALVRSPERARERFAGWLGQDGPEFITGSVESLPAVERSVDYVVHGASQTASRAFVEQAVETLRTAVYGTDNLLRLAREKKVSGFVYLSSMEVYGHPARGHKAAEDEAGAFSPLDLRSSYPIGKLSSESLCRAYAAEYGVPAVIVRLTQTFGPGVAYDDGRVFAQFGRCALEGRDIVLHTKGETERCYLYVADAVTAILTALLRGEPGQAYNAADESTYCSIADMARTAARLGGVGVRFELRDVKELGYPDTVYLRLDTAKLRSLGWDTAGYTLADMFQSMIDDWKR